MARIAVEGSQVYILDGDFIKTVPTAGGTVEKIAVAHGDLGDFSLVNQDIAVDVTSVDWTIKGIAGGPTVQKVALTGGAPVTLSMDTTLPNPQDGGASRLTRRTYTKVRDRASSLRAAGLGRCR